jgi:hypothetical protein
LVEVDFEKIFPTNEVYNDILTHDEKSLFIEERDEWLKEQERSWMVNEIRKAILKDDLDRIIHFIGYKGTGKSTAMIRLLMMVYPEWTLWNNLAFSVLRVQDIIAQSTDGLGLGWDETKIDWDKFSTPSKKSRQMDNVLTTVREKHICFGFTGVAFTDIAKPGRKLVTYLVDLRKKGAGILYTIWVGAREDRVGFKRKGPYLFDALPDAIYRLYKKYRTFFVNKTLREARRQGYFELVERVLPSPKWYQAWEQLFPLGSVRYSTIESITGKGSASWIIKGLLATHCLLEEQENGRTYYRAVIPRDSIF